MVSGGKSASGIAGIGDRWEIRMVDGGWGIVSGGKSARGNAGIGVRWEVRTVDGVRWEISQWYCRNKWREAISIWR